MDAQATSRILQAKWEFHAVSNTDNAQLKEWHPAEVPGVVQTDLLHDGLIPDPFYQDNDTRLQWIGLTDWEYRTTFDADAATLAHDHVDLVFEGLDTYADVYVNEQLVLHSDNMFRHWRVPAKTLLKAGPNTLRVVFHSPIESMIPKVKALPYILPSVTSHMTGNEEDIATAPYTRKAPYQYGWDWGPRYVTEGIWKPIRLETWDALRIENFHIQQQSVTQGFCRRSMPNLKSKRATARQRAWRSITQSCPALRQRLSGKACSWSRASIGSALQFALLIPSCGIRSELGRRTAIVFRRRCGSGATWQRMRH